MIDNTIMIDIVPLHIIIDHETRERFLQLTLDP